MLDAVTHRRFSNHITGFCFSTSHSQSAAVQDSHWTKVTNTEPRPRPDTRIMADEVMQRPNHDASWVKCVLFFTRKRTGCESKM